MIRGVSDRLIGAWRAAWCRPGLGVAGLVLMGWVTGCQAPRQADRVDEVISIPEAYEVKGGDGEGRGACCDWGIPELEALMERGFEENLDLRAAWARWRQAEAVRRRARASLWPALTLDGQATRSQSPFGGFAEGLGGLSGGPAGGPSADAEGGPGGISLEQGDPVTFYRGSVGASYEVDVWGRLRGEYRAAELDREAARADANALWVSLSARIAEAWLDVVTQREKMDLMEAQQATSERLLELVGLRFREGQVSGLDIDQQRQQVEAIRGGRTEVEAAQGTAENELAVLLGRAPGSVVLSREVRALPEIPPAPDPGVPGELLKSRPDVRAAMNRLRAADHRTAAAVADRLPKLRLSASLFVQATELSELVDDLLWEAAGSVSQPIFEGGRRQAEVDRTEAVAEGRLYELGQTLLTAMREVRDALVRQAHQAERIDSLQKQRESAERAWRVARQRYRQGAESYLRVLTALRTLQEVEVSLLEARRRQFSNRIQLCRALGGVRPDRTELVKEGREDS